MVNFLNWCLQGDTDTVVTVEEAAFRKQLGLAFIGIYNWSHGVNAKFEEVSPCPLEVIHCLILL